MARDRPEHGLLSARWAIFPHGQFPELGRRFRRRRLLPRRSRLARGALDKPGVLLARNGATAGRLHAATGAHRARSRASWPAQRPHRSDWRRRRAARMLYVRNARLAIAAIAYLPDRDADG